MTPISTYSFLEAYTVFSLEHYHTFHYEACNIHGLSMGVGKYGTYMIPIFYSQGTGFVTQRKLCKKSGHRLVHYCAQFV